MEGLRGLTSFFQVDKRLEDRSRRAMEQIAGRFAAIDEVTEYNQQKVLRAFIDHGVSETHFAPTTGYGYGDRGRDTLDKVFAQVMGAEDALVRHSIVSGTHAITIALSGVLRPGDTLLAATGAPYDTLEEVIGIRGDASGSLKDFGIAYRQVDLKDGRPDIPGVVAALTDDVKMVHIQRSRGYDPRPSLSVEEIGRIIRAVRQKRPDVIVFVDNCYGEFVEPTEPTQVGADLMAGSLIKNPGGGIAENGGYLCGRADLIEQCAFRMTTPGLGREVGASLGHNRSLFMGLFHAPHVVGEALKTAVYTAALFGGLGFAVSPTAGEPRADIIQTVCLGTPEGLVAFCQGMQKGAPVDAFVTPEPWDMPGYEDPVIMAAGAFTMGASIELSADGPLREPYAAYMQGGLNFHSGKVGVLLAAQSMLEQGALEGKL
ncbi:MAG: aminotransferase class I/II-fold pyridoxal phosphate-dependent enzyme [Acutalibacteraceae bacterium]|jgi:cystathionine beta-lyase family protein involved in aluminum resistance